MVRLNLRQDIISGLLYWLLCTGGAVAAGYEGRWNLDEENGERTFCSWLEVARSGDGWQGRFLHRGGHAMPADVKIGDEEIRITMVPDQDYSGRSNWKPPVLIGRLEAGKLVGTGTDSRGNSFTFTGVRAPDRLEGSDRKVSWGVPVELFNKKDLSGWETIGDRANRWRAVEGVLVNQSTGANLRTKEAFRDFKLELEFKIPEGSNSGVYLRGRYETQVADNFGQEPHSRGVGGIYGLITPTVNAAKPAGEWNKLEATLIGYRVTIVVNGQTTIDGKLIDGITGGALDTNETAGGPIMLQGDHGTVYYRNIVLTPAE